MVDEGLDPGQPLHCFWIEIVYKIVELFANVNFCESFTVF